MKETGLIYISIILLLMLTQGCDSVTEPGSVVSGKVLSVQQAALNNVRVKIGERETRSAQDGSFSISNVSFPYDVTLSVDNINEMIRYKGLNSTDLNLLCNLMDRVSLFSINVKIPDELFRGDLSTMLVFSDGMNINNYKLIEHQTTPSSVTFSFSYAAESYNGKFYLLSFKEVNGKIISYENFGMSDEVTVGLNGINSYTFTGSQVSLDPEEIDINVTLIPAAGSSVAFSYYYLTFSDHRNYTGEYRQWEIITDPSYTVKYPVNLPVECLPFITVYTNFTNTSGVEKFRLNTTTINTFNLGNIPQLISPPDNESKVTDNTVFSYQGGDGNGIYRVIMFDPAYNTPFIYLSGTSFTFDEMRKLGLNYQPGKRFSWEVTKMGSFSSIDDFAKNYFNKEESFVKNSVLRNITAAP